MVCPLISASLHPAAFISASHLLIWPGLRRLPDYVHPGLTLPRQPQAQSISHCWRCHFGNQERSFISIDLFFPSSLNCYLLWESVPCGQCSLTRERWPKLLWMSRIVADPTGLRKKWCMNTWWMNEWMNESMSCLGFLITVGVPSGLTSFGGG